VQIPAEFTCL